jgi:enoyl-CoA hydratase/carnithine racemase
VDGQAFGGGVEMACALAMDRNTTVLITNRTTFALPETKLGIFPGLRGTLNLPQLIYRKTGDAEAAVALARYYMLAAGTATSSPQIIYYLGLADAIVPQHRRDEAAAVIAEAIIKNGGKTLTTDQFNVLKFERLSTRLSPADAEELRLATEIFSQTDVLFSLYAEGRGQLPLWYTGDTKTSAERVTRRVTAGSPHAVTMTNYLIARGFEGFLNGVGNDTLAAWELEHHLISIFEHPDALIGLEALVQGKFPEFRRRYPF